MKSVLRDIRLIPILLIATCCLVVLKVSGLLLEGGYILGDDMPKPKSWAQENLGFPSTGKMLDTSDITGSVPAKKEEKPAAPVLAAAPPPPDDIVYPDPNRPITSSERAVLESLQARRQEIEARAREIDIRESLMKSAEKRIEGKLEEMKATEARVSVAGQQKNEQDNARFKGLVTAQDVGHHGSDAPGGGRAPDRRDGPPLHRRAFGLRRRSSEDRGASADPAAQLRQDH